MNGECSIDLSFMTMSPNDPVFATPLSHDGCGTVGVNQIGLTIRQYTVIQIAAGLAGDSTVKLESVPEAAVKLADLLLAELSKESNNK